MKYSLKVQKDDGKYVLHSYNDSKEVLQALGELALLEGGVFAYEITDTTHNVSLRRVECYPKK